MPDEPHSNTQLLEILNRTPPVKVDKVGIETLDQGWEGCTIRAEIGDQVA